ncbi:hypothetical protein CWO90_20395 [Bradyrhizobium sp. Leo121]|nr:hypothetical protein CWO90_20395 [Bradyrhizobium sp. Leo121]
MVSPGVFAPVLDETTLLPIEFPNGRAAANRAQILSSTTGKKYQPRRIKTDTNWRAREQARFDDGSYEPLPWINERWWRDNVDFHRDHFAHVSTDQPGKIAFTESEQRGATDTQTRMKAGKYLTRFFAGILTKEQIAKIASEFAARYEENVLLFAETADEIEEVYRNGPHSCMSNEDYRRTQGWGRGGSFSSPFHPVRVYAAGDLKVAYIQHDGHVTGRTLVFPKNKTHSRVYGDYYRMRELLAAQGYEFGDPIGARLVRHFDESMNTMVLPYLDKGTESGMGSLAAVDRGSHLEIIYDDGSQPKMFRGCNLNGYGSPVEYSVAFDEEEDDDGYQCDRCGDWFDDDDDLRSVINEGRWCEHCRDNYGFYCEGYGRWHSNDREISYTLSNGQVVSERYFDSHCFTCDFDSEHYYNEDAVEMANGERWYIANFRENGFTCDMTGRRYPNEERVDMANGQVWSQKYFDRYGFACTECGENFPLNHQHPNQDETCRSCGASAELLPATAEASAEHT